MGRHKATDRSNVTDREGPTVAVRLTPIEHEALSRLVESQQAQHEALGIAARASGASVIRVLLRREAQARGFWPGEAPPPAPESDPRQLPIPGTVTARVIDAGGEVPAPQAKPPAVPKPAPTPIPVKGSKPQGKAPRASAEVTNEDVHAQLLRAVEAGIVMSAIQVDLGIRVRDFKRKPNGTLNHEKVRRLSAWLSDHGYPPGK